MELPLVPNRVKILLYLTRKSSTGSFSIALLISYKRQRTTKNTLKNGVYCKNTRGKALKQEMEMLQTEELEFFVFLMLSYFVICSLFLSLPADPVFLVWVYFYYFMASVYSWFLLPHDYGLQTHTCRILMNGFSLSTPSVSVQASNVFFVCVSFFFLSFSSNFLM